MTTDDIKALVGRLKTRKAVIEIGLNDDLEEAIDGLTALLSQVETLTLENQRLRVDAERYRFIKSKTKTFSLDMGGQHTYVIDFSIARLRGPSFDVAVDNARAQIDKENS